MRLGAESVVYEALLDGKKVAVKKPILSTSDDLDKFHKELQLLWYFYDMGYIYMCIYILVLFVLCIYAYEIMNVELLMS